MTDMAPVLFVSHGSPMFAIEPGQAGEALARLGRRLLPGLRAVLVVSPHWMTRNGVAVTTAEHPDTMHDFGGFPDALYQLRYPVAGAPTLAERTLALLREAGFNAFADAEQGLDHGAWVPLMHLLPGGPCAVYQVSLPWPTDTAGAFRLGRALAPLREEGVLIIGSGSLTHNLGEFRRAPADTSYVARFSGWVRERLEAGDVEALLAYRRLAPDAERAHPTEEHFLPLLVALGATRKEDRLDVLAGGVAYDILSMDAYLFGSTALA